MRMHHMADEQHMILNKNWEKERSIAGKDVFVMNMGGAGRMVKINISVIRSVCKLHEVRH